MLNGAETSHDDELKVQFRLLLKKAAQHELSIKEISRWADSAFKSDRDASNNENLVNKARMLDTFAAALKKHRNDHIPISSLPPEILAAIFSHYLHLSNGGLRWTELLLVCRHWYSVAIAQPYLWSFLVFGWESVKMIADRTQEQVSRSIQHPLALKWACRQPINQVLPHIVPHLHRLRSLRITDFSQGQEIVAKLMHLGLPVLEELYLERKDEDPMELPDTFFLLPSLRALDLIGFLPSWQDLATLSKLRHLAVSLDHETKPSLRTVLSTLEQMPLLQTLQLSSCLPCDSAESNLHAPPFHHLISVRLVAPVRPLIQFLEAIEVRQPCAFTLVAMEKYERNDWQPLLNLALKKFHVARARPIRSLELCRQNLHPTYTIGVRGYCDTDVHSSSPDPQHLEHSIFNCMTLMGPDPNDAANATKQILDTFPVHGATMLDAKFSRSTEETVWSSVFTSLPLLNTVHIRINDKAGLAFLNALLQRLGERVASGQRSSSIPPLRHIHLFEVTRDNDDSAGDHPEFSDETLEESLLVLLDVAHGYRAMGVSLTIHTEEDEDYMDQHATSFHSAKVKLVRGGVKWKPRGR